MKRSLFAIMMIFVISMPLQAQKMRIAVMNFKAKGVSRSLAENVSELIRGEMINTGRYTVIERAQMNNILKEQGFQRTGCTDVSCAVEIGKILSAKKILIGTVMKMGGMIIITARIVDVQSGSGEFSAKQNAKSEKDLYHAVSVFTRKLTNRIDGTVTSAYDETPAIPAADAPFAYDLWYMGMEYVVGMTKTAVDETGCVMMAMSFCNSYGSLYHFGLKIGGLAGFEPGWDDYDDYEELLPASEYRVGTVYAIGNIAGIFAELTLGANLRIPSNWFGATLYGGLGIFKGKIRAYYHYLNRTESFYTNTYEFEGTNLSYYTPYFTLGVVFPMGRTGSKFLGPIFQIMVLPTPDDPGEFSLPGGTTIDKSIDESKIYIFSFGLKHVW